jgi:cytochrome P450
LVKTSGALQFDPRDSSLFVDGRREATFAHLRECDRLVVDDNYAVPMYSLVRYEDVERAYKEADIFSPCAGLTLDAFDPAGCDSPGRMMETAAPDLHRELKGAMQGAFRGDGLARVKSTMEDQLDRFLTVTVAGEAVEFVGAFTRGAATNMMLGLLGVPATEAERLTPALEAIGTIDFGESPDSQATRQRMEFRLLRELTRAVRARRSEEAGEGVIGLLLAAEVEGGQLSDQEVALNAFNVAIAGTGAVQHVLAAAAAVWADHPAALAAAAADPKLGRRFIDETLRWLTPVTHLTRILSRDIEIRGNELAKGSGVCLWNISANRDEAVFENATAFEPERPLGRSLAFGAGPQYCIGAEVARVQLGVLLAGLGRQGVRFELLGPPAWMPSNAITGVEELPLRVRR